LLLDLSLSLDLDVYRGTHRLLESVRIDHRGPGAFFLLGPAGVGKTTLLKSLLGKNDAPQMPRFEGSAEFGGEPMHTVLDHTVWVPQKTELNESDRVGQRIAQELGTDQLGAARWCEELGFADAARLISLPAAHLDRSTRRALSVLLHLARPARLYIIDEPSFGMEDSDAQRVRTRLVHLASSSVLLIATHNRRDCKAVGGELALLAGGRLQEAGTVAAFFEAPRTAAGEAYVEAGSCALADPVRPADDVCSGCWWAIKGLLCGMSRPGLVSDLEPQIDWLSANGIEMLVGLEERPAQIVEALRERGIAYHHFAIRDMEEPSISQAVDFCRLAERYLQSNRGVAVHCRGGLGRTGTMIACLLAWYGDSPEDAVARVRRARPNAIQTDAQEQFITSFANRIQGWHFLEPLQEEGNEQCL
jgi:atypical dual specificity phosphatase